MDDLIALQSQRRWRDRSVRNEGSDRALAATLPVETILKNKKYIWFGVEENAGELFTEDNANWFEGSIKHVVWNFYLLGRDPLKNFEVYVRILDSRLTPLKKIKQTHSTDQ